jgi:hypothetical protein
MLGPNLFLIGAMKSGTSSLHNYLDQHPQIFMSSDKEPSFFTEVSELRAIWPELVSRWPYAETESYLRLFEGGQGLRYRGESSTAYTKYPVVSSSPELIYRFDPDARLIYLIRNPVERAISHYWHAVANDGETRNPLTAFKKNSHYLDVSNYHRQIERYLEYFPPDQLLVVTTEALEADANMVLSRIFDWLDLEQIADVSVGSRSNVTPDSVNRLGAFGLLEELRHSQVYSAVESLIPKQLRTFARSHAVQNVERRSVDMKPALEFLEASLADQRTKLEQLLSIDLSVWSRA